MNHKCLIEGVIMVFCQDCGKFNREDANYCKGCGVELSVEDDEDIEIEIEDEEIVEVSTRCVPQERQIILCGECGSRPASHSNGLCDTCHIKQFL